MFVNISQAVTCSLSMVGFGESISALIHQDSIWISRAIAVGVLLLLLGNVTPVFIFTFIRSAEYCDECLMTVCDAVRCIWYILLVFYVQKSTHAQLFFFC